MTISLGVLLGALGAIVTGVSGFLVNRRLHSGQVVTTPAETLWAEATKMREDLRGEMLASRQEVAEARVELAAARSEAADLRREVAQLRRQVEGLQRQLDEVRAHGDG